MDEKDSVENYANAVLKGLQLKIANADTELIRKKFDKEVMMKNYRQLLFDLALTIDQN